MDQGSTDRIGPIFKRRGRDQRTAGSVRILKGAAVIHRLPNRSKFFKRSAGVNELPNRSDFYKIQGSTDCMFYNRILRVSDCNLQSKATDVKVADV